MTGRIPLVLHCCGVFFAVFLYSGLLFSSLLFSSLLCSSNGHADLIFSAPPRESEQLGKELYGPLAEHLSTLIGERVSYQYPQNWLQYQRDLRRGVYDIVFDGPHFISWRMAHLDHRVLVKLPGTLEFVIVVSAADSEVKKVNDLIGKKICAIPPPNLATLTAIDLYQNPVRQPVIWGVKGGYLKVYEAFTQGKCRAAVFRTTFYKKGLTARDRSDKKVLFKSKPLPNQAISVSQKIKKNDHIKIIRSMTLGKGKAISTPIVRRFGGKKGRPFIAANEEEYRAHSKLLEGVVFGW